MSNAEVSLSVIMRTLDNEACVGEPLLLCDEDVPEMFADTARRATTEAIRWAQRHFDADTPEEWARIAVPTDPEVFSTEIEIEPPVRSPLWQEPVTLRFQGLRWVHNEKQAAAYVPALKIAVLADELETLNKRVVAHIRFALFREELARNLWTLSQLQRDKDVAVSRHKIVLSPKTPKQRKLDASKDDVTDEAKTLNAVGTRLSYSAMSPLFGMEQDLQRMASALQGKRAGSVLLVGPSGVGKTALVHELARLKSKHGLLNRRFYSTSGARLIAGMGGFGMWQERCRKICREAAKQRVILHVGGLVELMEVGKSIRNEIGMASFLRPYLQRGELQIIAECTSEEIPIIEREDAHLLQAFQRIDIEEPDAERGRDILLNVAVHHASRQNLSIDEEAIDLLDRLHRRFASYSAYPGRPVRFLTNLLKDKKHGKETVTSDDVLKAFSEETGIPPVILNTGTPLDLAATYDWFAARVMGQPEALRQVVDLLAVIKSRLARANKPLASLLFAGPTGVGKTETAKALAEFLFGNRDRLVRFDMSEYADPQAAARLIAGGASGEGLLTRCVREQPFSVVLLDEFEKAHPGTYDLLLQVMGEGRLTDAKGRLADFRNCVIIMTSNLGAVNYQKGSLGFAEKQDVRREARDHFVGEVRKFLRPEMFNRIDHIIAFAPLDEATLLGIAQRELRLIQRRDGLHYRRMDLNIDEEVARHLVAVGFDLRYGARPIKRTAEEQLVAVLSERLNEYSDRLPLRGDVLVQDQALAVEVSAGSLEEKSDSLLEMAAMLSQMRRNLKRMRRSEAVVQIENDVFRLTRLEKKHLRQSLKKKGAYVAPSPELKKLAQMREVLDALSEFEKRAGDAEKEFLVNYYQGHEINLAAVLDDQSLLMEEIDSWLLRLLQMQYERSDVVIGVYGSDVKRVKQLMAGYWAVAKERKDFRIEAEYVLLDHDKKAKRRTIRRIEIKDIKKFFSDTPQHVVGIIFYIHGNLVYPLFEPESGLHVFKSGKGQRARCLVDVGDQERGSYVVPSGVERIDGFQSASLLRTYNCDDHLVLEAGVEKVMSWNVNRLHLIFPHYFEQRLRVTARRLVGLAVDE